MQQKQRLERQPDEGMIAGVAAGIAERYGIDVTLVRLAFVAVAIISGGAAVIAYLIAAVLMPRAQDPVGTASLKHGVDDLVTRGKGLLDETKRTIDRTTKRNGDTQPVDATLEGEPLPTTPSTPTSGATDR